MSVPYIFSTLPYGSSHCRATAAKLLSSGVGRSPIRRVPAGFHPSRISANDSRVYGMGASRDVCGTLRGGCAGGSVRSRSFLRAERISHYRAPSSRAARTRRVRYSRVLSAENPANLAAVLLRASNFGSRAIVDFSYRYDATRILAGVCSSSEIGHAPGGRSFPTSLALLWSVSIEEQFYIAWPWLMRIFGLRLSLVRRRYGGDRHCQRAFLIGHHADLVGWNAFGPILWRVWIRSRAGPYWPCCSTGEFRNIRCARAFSGSRAEAWHCGSSEASSRTLAGSGS